MGLVNSGVYVLAAFYQNTRTSDELRCLANYWRKIENSNELRVNFYSFIDFSDFNVMYISELYNRTEARVNYELARCPAQITINVTNGGPYGVWGSVEWCPGKMRAVGFNTKVEKDVWIDKTALNGIRLHCRETGNSQETTITSTVGP
jgi:Vitelline membrane outer layer protein I (VOMI)